VLDWGTPADGMLEYFSVSACKVYYDTFPDSICTRMRDGFFCDYADVSVFEQELLGQEIPRCDAVLLWDYLEYLQPDLQKIVLSVLHRWCRPNARVYLQTYQGVRMPSSPAPFAVYQDRDEMTKIASRTDVPSVPAQRISTRRVLDWLTGFTVQKLHLMQDARQEHLFILRS